jgi:hypothetical protein
MAGFGLASLYSPIGWGGTLSYLPAIMTTPAVPAAPDDVRRMLMRTNTDMGAAFKKKNKRATHPNPEKTNTLDDPCTVVVHEYGPDGYIRHESTQKFSSVEQMLKELPVLVNERPEWANVRLQLVHFVVPNKNGLVNFLAGGLMWKV